MCVCVLCVGDGWDPAVLVSADIICPSCCTPLTVYNKLSPPPAFSCRGGETGIMGSKTTEEKQRGAAEGKILSVGATSLLAQVNKGKQ